MTQPAPEGNGESGGSLREKLEAALAEVATLRTEVLEGRATKLIGDKGYKFVTPEDLRASSLDELEAKASALETEKVAAATTAVRSAFAAKGLAGDELEAAVQEVFGEAPDSARSGALDRIRSVGQLGGTTVGT